MGSFAYQLAVVVDDAAQGITDVVRGADLFCSTPRQIFLQRLLGVPTPRYLHLPVAVNGQRREAVEADRGAAGRRSASARARSSRHCEFLGQAPPAGLAAASPRTVLEWAAANWDRARIPRVRVLPAPDPR